MPETNGQYSHGRDGYDLDDLTAITATLYGRSDLRPDRMDRGTAAPAETGRRLDRLAALVERDRRDLYERLRRLESRK